MTRRLAFSMLLVFGLLTRVWAGAAAPSTNLLPNPSFEFGRGAPDQWSVFALGAGSWQFNGRDGDRCVTVTGGGNDTSYWRPTVTRVEPGRLYQVSYWVRRDRQTTASVVIAGLDRVNRDSVAGPEWERRQFFFRAPDAILRESFFRVGQWHVTGTLYFDEVSLTPALAVNGRPTGLDLPLGEGERIIGGRYTAAHVLNGPGSTYCRFLESFTARFNSNRWTFGDPGEVVYRHRVGRLRQAESEVEVSVNRHERGTLLVEASGDGRTWLSLGEIAAAGTVAFPVPSALLPTRDLLVRLRTEGRSDLQVNDYRYRCRLVEVEGLEPALGATHYLAVTHSSPELQLEAPDLGDLLPGGRSQAHLVFRNGGDRLLARVAVTVEMDGSEVCRSEETVSLPTGVARRVVLDYDVEAAGEHTLVVTCSDAETNARLLEARGDFVVPALHDARGGELLSDDAGLRVWWCEPERKIGRNRPVPTERGSALRISSAGNEYEPAQLVLTPSEPLAGCRLRASDLIADDGARIPAAEVEIRTCEYVFVDTPTDYVGSVGEWPDPLPLHDAPLDLAPPGNQPFWVTLHVPPGTRAGDYGGSIEITWEGNSQSIPLEVHVWDFDLPEETHVRSGFGLSGHSINRYHNLNTPEEQRQVRELYLRSFASHRVAPYSVGRGIDVTWLETPEGGVVPEIDFTGFDEDAHHSLDELGFNSFVLNLEGLGGGTYVSRRLGEIAGHQQGTPEHEEAFTRYVRGVQDHLSSRGWLDKTYIYWFDEPAERDYEFVRDGMDLIHRAGRWLTRMLTEQPTPELYGSVDLWCLSTPFLEPEIARERQVAGEEVWWYLCTGPKAPYFTLFLDHYGTEMRLWSWETWKYGLDGILVWQTAYWTSSAAYPEPALQNPWQDPMSWVSSYNLPDGGRRPWGNGDGRFFYPPNRDPVNDRATYLEGPVPSIRWEALRDGIEDYEYFWLLRAEIERLREAGVDPAVYQQAEGLLEVPEDVCTDLTHFTTTPEPIHAHRARLAEAIEELRAH